MGWLWGGCGDSGGGRLATRGGWQAAAHRQRWPGRSPIPSEDAYLRAVGLGHMAQHEERDVEEQSPNRCAFGWGRRDKDLGDLQPRRKEAGRNPVSLGAGTLLPPGSSSNPQSVCVRTRAAGDVPSASLHPIRLRLSPQSGFGLPFGSPSPSPGSPPRHRRSEHSASFITRKSSQSPYLGLCADTSPLPGREPGQGRPRGAPGGWRGEKELCPHKQGAPRIWDGHAMCHT